jgi:iron complex transport system permease protein
MVLEITFWLLGSLEDRSFRHVILALPFIIAGAAMLLSQRNAFRALSLGEETAQSLGVDVGRLRLLAILGVAFGVGGAVAVSGTIGFIGLVAPHLVRPLIGYDPARLLVPSALAGSVLLLAADIAVRIIPSTSDIRVGVLTSIIGVPFFLYLILRERRALGAGVT